MTAAELLRVAKILQMAGTAAAVVFIALAMTFHVEAWASWTIMAFYLAVVCVTAWLRGRAKSLAALASAEASTAQPSVDRG